MSKRETILENIRRNPEVSVLIVGGGINGIGLLRDLALQGVDALLVEKGDFCGGTSAASTRIIHGGLRYLQNFDIALSKFFRVMEGHRLQFRGEFFNLFNHPQFGGPAGARGSGAA